VTEGADDPRDSLVTLRLIPINGEDETRQQEED
jgi:hypothetical protein